MPGVLKLGEEGSPLNDSERAAIRRLFSDPGELPGAFKSWIPRHLETSPPYLPFEELAFRRPRLLAQDDATANQTLKWDDTNGYWTPGTIDHTEIAGEVALADIEQSGAATGDLMFWDGSSWNDTSMGTLSAGEYPRWNGSSWANSEILASDISTDITLGQLESGGAATGDLMQWTGSTWDDTAVGSLTAGDMLQWNGSNWENTSTGTLATGDLLQWNGSDWEETTTSGLATGDYLRWNGSDWANYNGDEYIAVGQNTSNTTVNQTAWTSANQIVSLGAVTYRAAEVEFIFSCPRVAVSAASGGNLVQIQLFQGSSRRGIMATFNTNLDGSSNTTNWEKPAFMRRLYTPSAGTHTFTAKAIRTNANGTVYGGGGGTDQEAPALLTARYTGR